MNVKKCTRCRSEEVVGTIQFKVISNNKHPLCNGCMGVMERAHKGNGGVVDLVYHKVVNSDEVKLDAEMINALIDVALMVRDFEWVKELSKLKEGAMV